MHTGGFRNSSEADPRRIMEKNMEIRIAKNILNSNENIAAENRRLFAEKKILAVNLMSSPGAGKTELLDATLGALDGVRAAVIEGDICTTLDSERLAHHGVPLVQVNTDTIGGACHLEACMIQSAMAELNPDSLDLLFVENVGNLVCPAEFDLGEDLAVSLLSVPEGADKPLKYPLMFRHCGVSLITKIDLAPPMDIDSGVLEANVKKINPDIPVIGLSAKTGEGMDRWLELLRSYLERKKKGSISESVG